MESVSCDDADIILVTTGTITGTCRQFVMDLRDKGEKVGLFKIKLFRPFPVESIRKHIGKAKKIAVIDRNFSFGASGIFAQEVRAALCNFKKTPPVFGFVAGLGGRDVTLDTLSDIYEHTKTHNTPDSESIWVGLKEVNHAI